MADDTTYDEATKVTAKDGEVILDGPDGVDVKVTPEAAEQTAMNLEEAPLRRAVSAASRTCRFANPLTSTPD
jgi:hypothetical protein